MFPTLFGANCAFDDDFFPSLAVPTFTTNWPYLYIVSETDDVFKVFDLTDTASPVLKSSQSVGSSKGPRNPYYHGGYLYVPCRTSRELQVWDVANPASPSLINTVDLSANTPGRPFRVAIIGTILCVAYSASFTMLYAAEKFDITNPTSPVSVDTWLPFSPLISTASDVEAVGTNFVFTGTVTGGSSNPYVATVSASTFNSLDTLTFGGSGDVGGELGPTSDGSYVYTYVGNNTHVYTIDISDPANISVAGDLNLSGTTGVGGQPSPLAVREKSDRLYLGRYNGGGLLIVIMDISTRSTPTLAGTISTGSDGVSDLMIVGYACEALVYGLQTSSAIHMIGDPPTS